MWEYRQYFYKHFGMQITNYYGTVIEKFAFENTHKTAWQHLCIKIKRGIFSVQKKNRC